MTSEVEALRQWYAQEIFLQSGAEDPALVDAFAAVPREDFLGPPPWTIISPRGRLKKAFTDPSMLYHCVLVEIDPERQLNNGEPSSLAKWIAPLGLSLGERVIHIGCGVGYYSAIMATLVGESGHLTAIEVDEALAERARRNLAAWPQATAIHGDASEVPQADAIFVNAGCTHPHPAWLEALRPGGRMILPLTDEAGRGGMFLIRREAERWTVRPLTHVLIYPCTNVRDPGLAAVIASVFDNNPERLREVRTLRLDAHPPDASCILHTDRYCLSSLL